MTSTLTARPAPAVGQAAVRGTEDEQAREEGKGEKRQRGVSVDGDTKRGRKGWGDGVMEEQMNRDLITRPLRPESVG